MSTIETIHQEVAALWNARDYEGIRALMHPDYVYTASDGEARAGAEAGIAVAKTYGEAFPDAHMKLKASYSNGNSVAAKGSGDHPDRSAQGCRRFSGTMARPWA